MSSQNKAFLKYLFHENIYLIDDALLVEQVATSQPNLLVEEEDGVVEAADVETKAGAKEPVAMYQSKGKSVLVLYENKEEAEMKAPELAYLQKILGAVKLQWGDVESRNVAQYPVTGEPSNPKIIAFTHAHGMGVVAPYVLKSTGRQQIIMAHDLTTIAASVEYRKQLWAALQQMFL
ncbi:hypothetical protein BFP72_10620 [Reichenbachiella sp. 5M10]|uniref:hypothetical protein n=1 Tax=Reichenbachiella sp. 5M10 TaxID=1889772 RepID=UPI000C162198|nr:hypothetical protein [Reichenbachiella sp. 5M10]PIB35813.1 hypothetical protein BFP72_10620 [Reichenbachiella sp. 5M10]